MKKTIILFIIAALVLITTGFWFFSSSHSLGLYDLLSFGVIILVVAFALLIGFRRLSSIKRGEPAEDEMSKKVIRKTASLSYYISIYMWLALGYLSDKIKLETHSIIGAGILGMAVVYGICWLVLHFTGMKNE